MSERIIMAAIICITILEAAALMMGHNGIILTTVIGALCVLAGKALPQFKFK